MADDLRRKRETVIDKIVVWTLFAIGLAIFALASTFDWGWP